MNLSEDDEATIERLIMKARHHANMRQVKSVTVGWVNVEEGYAKSHTLRTQIRPVVTVEFFE